MKKVNPNGSRTLYIGNVYEVDKNSAGGVTGTRNYYPAAGAMRVNSTLYLIRADHLGSASAVTDSSGNVVGRQLYYPFGQTRLVTGAMYTDRLFTGQREMAGLGIYHYKARFYSPVSNHFISADTIVPGYGNPQSLNRLSYVLNNPLRYTDPTGHMMWEGEGGGKEGCSNPIYCRGGKLKSRAELESIRAQRLKDRKNNTITTVTPTTAIGNPNTPTIGEPIDPGNYCGGYCGQGGGLLEYTTGSGTLGDSIGIVPLAYSTSYDVNVYDNLIVVTLHEEYWMPGRDIPNMEFATFGRSVLVSRLANGQQVKTNLGEFTPGSVAYPEQREHRDTSIQYYGKENFPTELIVQITFGAESLKATTVFYSLPFSP